MAKRDRDDEARVDEVAERSTKKIKKEKKKEEKKQTLSNGETTESSKADRKALKKARKDAAVASDDPDAAAKAAAKAAKKAKKAAKEASKTDGEKDAADDISLPGANGAPQEAYVESGGLAALPQSEIDAFVAEKQLTIEDPLKQLFRPIVAFKHLPGDVKMPEAFAKFSAPTPIQAACWPHLFAGRDVVGVAETGSGKTLGFGLPCVRHIASLKKSERNGIKACIVSPTRELALQIHEQLSALAQPVGLKATCVYGGVNKDEQRSTLKGTSIVVATPGRLNDFIQEGSIDLSTVDYLVLDEADRMLDKGFEEEIRKIIGTTPSTGRQTLMFTATWPQSVRDLASTFMDRPVKVTIGDNASGELRANTRIVQEVEVVEEMQKQGRLIDLLKKYQSGKNKSDRILVFCLYKKEATRIEEFIRRRGFNVAGIHGDLNQQKRTESLDAFKQGKVPLLVATDVAARGLDIPAVKVVINVTFPLTVEDYVHRIGRTGRAGQDGRAITLFTQNEKGLAGGLINVLKAANQPVPEELMKFGTTVKKKGHDAYGAFYKDTSNMKAATKITFD